jgi:triosephosphate isomerase (TIM)
MRKKLLAGNWKMNLAWNEAMTLFANIVSESKPYLDKVDIAVFPPSIYQRQCFEFAKQNKSAVIVGAQDCSAQNGGAFTGEVSAQMLRSIGVSHCLVGHSERREYHHEGSRMLSEKVERLLEVGLIPVFCCGESLQDRDNDNQTFVIDNQLDGSIFELNAELFSKVVIAYEPVWAIGTGRTATAEQAQDMHEFIRGLVQSKYGAEIAQNLRILYGGSMNESNAAELLNQPDVDGGLIGGASLKLDAFISIIKAAAL